MAHHKTSAARTDVNRCTRGSAPVYRGHWSSVGGGAPIEWREWCGDDEARTRAGAAMRAPLKGLPQVDGALSDRSVFVTGLGAVAGRTIVELTRAGVAVDCCDPDVYACDSFLTQPTTERAARAGKRKAWVQAARAHAANPAARVRATAGVVQDVPLRLLYDADVWIASVDNAEAIVWLGQRAAEFKKRLVQGSVHPETGSAILRAWDLRQRDAACPACGMGPRQWAVMHYRRGCDATTSVPAGATPTRTLPPICGTAGQLLAFEALKWLSGNDDLALASEELTYSLLSHRAMRTRLARNPSCPLPHDQLIVTDAPRSWAELSPAMLLAHYGAARADSPPTMRAEIPWISFALCQNCDRQQAVCRFGHAGTRVGRCDCGGELVVEPAGLRSMIPPAELTACRDRSLEDLGLPPDRSIGLMLGDRWHYVLPPRTIFDFPLAHDPIARGPEARP